MNTPSSSSASQKLAQNCRPSSLPQDPPSPACDAENLDPGVVHGERQEGYKFKVLSIAIQDYKESPTFKALKTPRQDQDIVVGYALEVGCRREDIRAMREDAENVSLHPTRWNIVSGACLGDRRDILIVDRAVGPNPLARCGCASRGCSRVSL